MTVFLSFVTVYEDTCILILFCEQLLFLTTNTCIYINAGWLGEGFRKLFEDHAPTWKTSDAGFEGESVETATE